VIDLENSTKIMQAGSSSQALYEDGVWGNPTVGTSKEDVVGLCQGIWMVFACFIRIIFIGDWKSREKLADPGLSGKWPLNDVCGGGWW